MVALATNTATLRDGARDTTIRRTVVDVRYALKRLNSTGHSITVCVGSFGRVCMAALGFKCRSLGQVECVMYAIHYCMQYMKHTNRCTNTKLAAL